MTNRNPFEAEARGRKVAAIVSALDKELIGIGRAEDIIEQLRSSSETFWRVLANAHGIRTPSAATIEAVLLTLEARVELDAERDSEPDWSEIQDDDRDDFYAEHSQDQYR